MNPLHPLAVACLVIAPLAPAFGHGSAASPESRVLRVYHSNPETPNFALAQNAVALDGKSSYYTWNQISQNIPEAVQAGLPAGFDYSPWVPDGHIASGGRIEGNVTGLFYEGLDQASGDWPKSPATAGEKLNVNFHATAVHEPSVWDVWMTTEDWNPNTPLNWGQMEFLGRPLPRLDENHYYFDVDIPTDRSGHHVLWIAWQRNDPVGEVFFSTSDLLIAPTRANDGDFNGDGIVDAADYTAWLAALGSSDESPINSNGDGGGVTIADYNFWKSSFGNTNGSGLANSAQVPEPASLMLVLIGIALSVSRSLRLP